MLGRGGSGADGGRGLLMPVLTRQLVPNFNPNARKVGIIAYFVARGTWNFFQLFF